ncbi:MAG: hypothetical protein QM656_13435 [Paracoccaceae bacterium]
MRANRSSTIAQLLYSNPPAPNFARLVAGMEKALSSFRATDRRLDWDQDDVAIFDIDHCRIALALTENPGDGHAACLTISAGPSPFLPGPDAAPFVAQHLCSALVEQIGGDLPADAILWSEVGGIVTAEALDELMQQLPSRTDIEILTPPQRRARPVEPPAAPEPAPEPFMLRDPVALPKAAVAAAPLPHPRHPRRLHPAAADLPEPLPTGEIIELQPRDPDLIRIRAALYPPEEEASPPRQSIQMRLAVHSMNATLLVVLLPLGAAMTTYTLLRGADMRITGRAMALAGFGLTVAKLHMVQALIG